MSHPVLRRTDVPRLHISMPRETALPGFLIENRAVPMAPDPVMGPPDRLEQAILDGQVWEGEADPVQIASFDAEHDVISVIVDKRDGALHFDVQESHDEVHILANGKTMARVATNGQTFSKSHFRVLQARASI